MKYITRVDNTHIIEVSGVNRKMSQEYSKSQSDDWDERFNYYTLSGNSVITIATAKYKPEIPYVKSIITNSIGLPLSEVVLAMEMFKLIREQTK